MQNGANWRSVIVIVAGLLTFCVTPSRACEDANCGRMVVAQNDDAAQTENASATHLAATKVTKPTRHAKMSSRRKTAGLSAKSGFAKKKAVQADTFTDSDHDRQNSGKLAVSPSVANANARMSPTADATDSQDGPLPGSASQASGGDANPPNESSVVVASDELNDLDRAAVEDKPAPRILRPVSATYQIASTGSNDAWTQTSLVGKLFIAFGGILTLASAARMFMA